MPAHRVRTPPCLALGLAVAGAISIACDKQTISLTPDAGSELVRDRGDGGPVTGGPGMPGDPVIVPDAASDQTPRDATADGRAGPCTPPDVLRYVTPGCGADAKPICSSVGVDAYAGDHPACSCAGVTIPWHDFAKEPFARFGTCEADGGAENPFAVPPPACYAAEGFHPISTCLWGDPSVQPVAGSGLSLDLNVAGTFRPATGLGAGTLLSFGPGCHSELADRFFAVDDRTGLRWTIGYSLAGAGPVQLAASLTGTEVTLAYRFHNNFGYTGGFVLRDTRGVLLAVENGEFGRAFRRQDLPEFSVEQGNTACRRTTTYCGAQDETSLIFAGTPPADALPGQPTPFQVAGTVYQALSVSSLRWVHPTCSDYADTVIWGAWRDDLGATGGCACGADRVCPIGAIYSDGCSICQCTPERKSPCQAVACFPNNGGTPIPPRRCEQDATVCGLGDCVFDQGCQAPHAYCAVTQCSHTFGEQSFCNCDGVTVTTDCPRQPYRHVGPCP